MRRWGQAVILLFGFIGCSRSEYTIEFPAESLSMLVQLQEENNETIPSRLLSLLIDSESSFDPYAVNNSNRDGTFDLGIAQLNSAYLEYFQEKFLQGEKLDPFNPYQSVLVAERYLRWLYEQTGCWEKAVIAYKAGLSKVDHPPKQAKEVARRIVDEVQKGVRETSRQKAAL